MNRKLNKKSKKLINEFQEDCHNLTVVQECGTSQAEGDAAQGQLDESKAELVKHVHQMEKRLRKSRRDYDNLLWRRGQEIIR